MLTNTCWNANVANNCTCQYGQGAQYSQQPPETCIECGVAPLDSLPAQWWNYLWCSITHQVTPILAQTLQYFYDELTNAILCNGVAALCNTDSTQLSQAINYAAQKIATTTTAGAIKSSTTPGRICVDASTGIATPVGMGDPTALTTTATSSIVAGVNELVTKYTNLSNCSGLTCTGRPFNVYCGTTCMCTVGSGTDLCLCANAFNANATISTTTYPGACCTGTSTVPTSHASTATTYGVGNANCYGHLKLADDTVCGCCDCNNAAGVAATPLTIYCALGGRSKVTYTLSGTTLCICLQ